MIRSSLFASRQAADPQDGELSAGSDMLAAVGISARMYKHATTRPLGNYFAGVMGNTQLYRGSQCDLGQLTGVFASNAKPDFRPLDRRVIAEAFTLQPGTASLSEEEKGQAVASDDLLGTPVVPMPLPQPRIAVKLPAASESKKEKKAKKEKKEKKDKKDDQKRKRSPAAP